ncbi:MAG TPA: carbohydrate ABC transporter permease [Actinomycetota bacterium]|nr:carbohydrate ABC transporter permease [Actinomycetota bacterium]
MSAAVTTTARRRPILRRTLPANVRRKRLLLAVADHALLIAVMAIFLIPLAFVLLTSLMTSEQALTTDMWPRSFEWDNYAEVFRRLPVLRYATNTMIIATLSTLGVILSSIPVAYALSRLRWRGRQATFVIVLATIMLPYQVTIVPLYVLFARYGWIPGFKPLIVPLFFGDAFSIFLLRQFFLTIPEELSDAARMEGASEWQIMTRVIVPLAKPAIAAVALFQFLYSWNDFFAPLLFLGGDSNLWTLAIGLNEFRGLHQVEYNLMLAAVVLFMLPVIVLFFFAQRVFMEGITVTGVKG